MGKLLLELLFLFLELVLEALFEFALGVIFDLLVRTFAALAEIVDFKNFDRRLCPVYIAGRRNSPPVPPCPFVQLNTGLRATQHLVREGVYLEAAINSRKRTL